MSVAALFLDADDSFREVLPTYSEAKHFSTAKTLVGANDSFSNLSHLFEEKNSPQWGKYNVDDLPSYSEAVLQTTSTREFDHVSELFSEDHVSDNEVDLSNLFNDENDIPERPLPAQNSASVHNRNPAEEDLLTLFSDDHSEEDQPSLADLFGDENNIDQEAKSGILHIFEDEAIKEENYIAELVEQINENASELREKSECLDIFEDDVESPLHDDNSAVLDADNISALFSDFSEQEFFQADNDLPSTPTGDNPVYDLFQGEPSPSNSPRSGPLPEVDGVAKHFIGEPDHEFSPRKGSLELAEKH